MATVIKRSGAALRIYTSLLSIAEISGALATVPTDSYDKGTPVSPSNAVSPLRGEALWLLDSGLDKAQPLEAHIMRLAEYVEQKLPVVEKLLLNCEIDIFCFVASKNGQCGFALEPDLLRRLTVIPMPLVFDIYPTDDTEPV